MTMLTCADLDANDWAACGQTAVAALLRRPLVDMRAAFPPHPWCNLRDTQTALAKLGARWRPTPPDHDAVRLPGRASPARWPSRGLAQIFFNGPWDAPKVPFSASFKASHWVAVSPPIGNFGVPMTGMEPFVFDVNTLDAGWNGGWMPRSWWQKNILGDLIACYKRATGGWWVRAGIEVST